MSVTRARAAKILEKIVEQIAKEEGLTVKKVNGLLHTVFQQIAADIRSGTLKGTHIRYLGKFLVKPYKIHKYYEDQNKDGSDTQSKRRSVSRERRKRKTKIN